MSGQPIIVEKDSDGSVSSSSKKGMEFESYSFPSISGGFELWIIILSDDSRMDDTFGESLSDEDLSINTLEYLFPIKYDGGENLTEILMPPSILTEAEREFSRQRRECVGLFVKT